METERDISGRIRDWLDKQGFPLEMRVGRAFQNAHARVVQSEYYPDRVTGEWREVDVVADWSSETDPTVTVRATFVVECKSSRDKPWLLFTAKNRMSEVARIAQRAGNRFGDLLLDSIAGDRHVQALRLFELPRSPAYGMRQAFGDRDVCHAAISSVAAATAAFAAEPDYQDWPSGRWNFCQIFLPVVVTDARLFSAQLDESGQLLLEEISTGALVWRNPMIGAPHTIIHVVSESALPDFVNVMGNSAKQLLQMLTGNLRPLVDAALERRTLERSLAKGRGKTGG